MALKTTSLVGNVLLGAVVVCAVAMMGAGSAAAQKGARPCDVIGSATPCVNAISTTRALYRGYAGPLYQVTRASDKTTAERWDAVVISQRCVRRVGWTSDPLAAFGGNTSCKGLTKILWL